MTIHPSSEIMINDLGFIGILAATFLGYLISFSFELQVGLFSIKDILGNGCQSSFYLSAAFRTSNVAVRNYSFACIEGVIAEALYTILDIKFLYLLLMFFFKQTENIEENVDNILLRIFLVAYFLKI